MSYSVGAKGQVVIPKYIRDELHILPGQELQFELRGDEIVVRKPGIAALKGRFAASGLTDELLRARAEDKALDDSRS